MVDWKVVYFNLVPEQVRRLVADLAPVGFNVVFLDSSDQDEIISKSKSADFILAGTLPVTKEVIQSGLTSLKLIQRHGLGYDSVDIKAAAQYGIPVAIVTEGGPQAVAEHAVMLMLAALRNLVYAYKGLRSGKWMQWDLRLSSYQLGGKTVGIIGCGRVGRELAKRLKGFGLTLQYFDQIPLPDKEEFELGLKRVGFSEILETSDIISIHMPLTDHTRGLLGPRELASMKKGSIIINTARGGIVDENALIDYLQSGHLGGAGLDVFQQEPLDPGSQLFDLPNVILTPHLAGGTRESFENRIRASFENISRVAQGLPPCNRVN